MFPAIIARRGRRTMDLSVVSSFKRLGAGSFATVFVSEGRGAVVVKQVKNPSDTALLQKEHGDLEQLYQAYSSAGKSTFFSLPRPYGYYGDYWSFAQRADIPRTLDLGLPPHAMYVMQRIWPVPNSITERIRNMFFPDRVKEQPFAPFLARLYLGKASARADSQFFCSENYPLDASRLERLGLPTKDIAAGMGQMLALINFQAGKDARDIEFVLCGDPDNPLSSDPTFSCIDFNQMRPHNNDAEAIVSSISANDPYFPRPSSQHWVDFADAYEDGAVAVDPMAADIARSVLAHLRELWK
ncbi:hypothetical protein CEUSTIGMA_g13621.t1 [Chlamydomonas eustigma]|uniref:DUF3669 domain-containing protein n=1 Tax=Chlamydomonas eustigma TaxID=1157962 RepID=A0A250XT08_9CHLO|nr:hypothetical protein CEUSTIGMA_g13621.t1 [Chlamydomonas eustigma]|eukprot:GAX86207.1 hypothetical protein CEUSTIGMA_g13621.t1 [Chlamydomonas eustigma]